MNDPYQHPSDASKAIRRIHQSASTPPITVPDGHIGPVILPGSGRQIWWTGRVAIGLRHEPERFRAAAPESTLWIRPLMLGA